MDEKTSFVEPLVLLPLYLLVGLLLALGHALHRGKGPAW